MMKPDTHIQNNCWDVLPEQFIEKIKLLTPPEHLEETMSSFCDTKSVTFRTNTLKISTENLRKKLDAGGIKYGIVPWYKDAFVLRSPKQNLTATSLFSEGLLYIQSLSSMLAVLALDPKPDENILDLTAAPGSKTSHIAMLMQDTGQLVANDISRTRLYKLRSNLETQGVTNAKVLNFPGQMLWKKFPEYFDKVLVDAPCTMEGRFYSGDPKTYRDWKPKKVKILSGLQRILLRSACSATKPGGVIVYSTCTLSPEENEEVIDWMLSKETGNIALSTIAMTGFEGIRQGLTEWRGRKLHPQIARTSRVLPSQTMEGFFIARFEKLRSSLNG